MLKSSKVFLGEDVLHLEFRNGRPISKELRQKGPKVEPIPSRKRESRPK